MKALPNIVTMSSFNLFVINLALTVSSASASPVEISPPPLRQQCNQLIESINRIRAEERSTLPQDPAIQNENEVLVSLDQQLALIDRALTTLETLSLSHPQLKTFQQRFLRDLRQQQQLVQSFKTALVAQDMAAVQRLQQDNQTLPTQGPLLVEINQLCGRSGASLVEFTQTEQCNQLVAVANQAVDEAESATTQAIPDNSAAMTQIAATAEHALTAMGNLHLNDPQLQAFQQEFITMYLNTSRATRSLIRATESRDRAASERAFENLQAATGVEESLVHRVNIYCVPVPEPQFPIFLWG